MYIQFIPILFQFIESPDETYEQKYSLVKKGLFINSPDRTRPLGTQGRMRKARIQSVSYCRRGGPRVLETAALLRK